MHDSARASARWHPRELIAVPARHRAVRERSRSSYTYVYIVLCVVYVVRTRARHSTKLPLYAHNAPTVASPPRDDEHRLPVCRKSSRIFISYGTHDDDAAAADACMHACTICFRLCVLRKTWRVLWRAGAVAAAAAAGNAMDSAAAAVAAFQRRECSRDPPATSFSCAPLRVAHRLTSRRLRQRRALCTPHAVL